MRSRVDSDQLDRSAIASACEHCAFGPVCADAGCAEKVTTQTFVEAGRYLFHGGCHFEVLYAVSSGCLKTSVTHADSREHVLNFHFPGEIIGIDAVYLGKYASDAIALTDSFVCSIRFSDILEISGHSPDISLHLLRTFSRDSFSIGTLTGDFSAEERLAGFLMSLTVRMGVEGKAVATFQLPMDRTDIANHLRLATETVSRVLARFQEQGLIEVDRKLIKVLNRQGLETIAACINPYARYRQA